MAYRPAGDEDDFDDDDGFYLDGDEIINEFNGSVNVPQFKNTITQNQGESHSKLVSTSTFVRGRRVRETEVCHVPFI